VRSAVTRLLRELRELILQIEALDADDWGAETLPRLLEYARNVVRDLESGGFEEPDPTQPLVHLSELGTDLVMHQTLARWEDEQWNRSLAKAEQAALRLRDVLCHGPNRHAAA